MENTLYNVLFNACLDIQISSMIFGFGLLKRFVLYAMLLKMYFLHNYVICASTFK